MIIGNWLHPTLCHHHLLLCRSEKRTPGKKEIWLTWIVHLLRRCWLQLRIPDRNWIGAWATTMMPAVWASQYVTSLLLKSQEVTFMPRKQMMNRCWSRRSFATTGKAFPMIQVSVIKPIEMQCRIFSLFIPVSQQWVTLVWIAHCHYQLTREMRWSRCVCSNSKRNSSMLLIRLHAPVESASTSYWTNRWSCLSSLQNSRLRPTR